MAEKLAKIEIVKDLEHLMEELHELYRTYSIDCSGEYENLEIIKDPDTLDFFLVGNK